VDTCPDRCVVRVVLSCLYSLTDRGTGMGWFLTGFFIWNMDNIYCRYLKTARNHILLPWSVLLEGHGWWHIFTGLGRHIWPVTGIANLW
jgi:hypothetical protein